MFQDLLDPKYGIDDSPEDKTRITQVILYYNAPDVLELKKIAKVVMKDIWPEDYDTKGNLSLLFLELLKRYERHKLSIDTGVAPRPIEQKDSEDSSQALFF